MTLTGQVLLEAAAPQIRAQVDMKVRAAVDVAIDDRLGIPRLTADQVAQPILDGLARVHAEDVAGADESLLRLLDARLDGGGALVDEPAARFAVDETVIGDREAHAAALGRFEGALREALVLPVAGREKRVGELLAVERRRLDLRARSRVQRTVGRLAAAVRLSDEALDG